MGACGIQSSANDLIAAVSAEFYDTFPGATPNPNLNPVCKKILTLHHKSKSVTVMVTDKCPGCKGKFDLDLSPAAFNKLSDPSVGRLLGVKWSMHGKNQRRADIETLKDARAAADGITPGHRMVRRVQVEVKP